MYGSAYLIVRFVRSMMKQNPNRIHLPRIIPWNIYIWIPLKWSVNEKEAYAIVYTLTNNEYQLRDAKFFVEDRPQEPQLPQQ